MNYPCLRINQERLLGNSLIPVLVCNHFINVEIIPPTLIINFIPIHQKTLFFIHPEFNLLRDSPSFLFSLSQFRPIQGNIKIFNFNIIVHISV